MSTNLITKKIISWYTEFKRDLPWRETKDPYFIWISEVILQQTRVVQGLSYYKKFISTYPTINDLASSNISEVLRLWQGLGYYSRARNMHFAANQVLDSYDGNFPDTFEEILKLKGVGTYTAAAIASFAFGEAVPVVDGNVFRVLSRLFAVDVDIASSKAKKHFFELGKEIISIDDPATFNQAIMEFGSLQCVPRNPKCEECPVSTHCQAYAQNTVNKYPIKSKKIKIKKRCFNYVVFEYDDKIKMNERKEKGIWQGLYDFPLYETEKSNCTEEGIMEWLRLEYKLGTHQMCLNKVSREYKHMLSHQHIYAVFFHVSIKNNSTEDRVLNNNYTMEEIFKLPKPILIDNYLKESIN